MSVHLLCRRSAALLVVLLVCASVTTASAGSLRPESQPSATAAAVGTYPIVVSGDFTGDGADDLFFHSPGSSSDIMYDFTNVLLPPLFHDVSGYTFAVRGAYRPVVGDFTGDGVDDIFWYQPGPGADVVWDFTGGKPASYTRRPVTVEGSYRPVAGDFTGDGVDDVFWYGPGSTPDSIWDFNSSSTLSYRSRGSLPVHGSGYRPVAGYFAGNSDISAEDIFWYSTSGGTESVWNFAKNDTLMPRKSSASILQVRGNSYVPAVSPLIGSLRTRDDIVFVGPGAAADSVWDFHSFTIANPTGITKRLAPVPLGDAYTVAVGLHGGWIGVGGNVAGFFAYNPANRHGVRYDFVKSDFCLYREVNLSAPVTTPAPGPGNIGAWLPPC